MHLFTLSLEVTYTYWIVSPSPSKLRGTTAPASFKALFLASAVSAVAFAQDPAWPNCTCKHHKHNHYWGLWMCIHTWPNCTCKHHTHYLYWGLWMSMHCLHIELVIMNMYARLNCTHTLHVTTFIELVIMKMYAWSNCTHAHCKIAFIELVIMNMYAWSNCICAHHEH